MEHHDGLTGLRAAHAQPTAEPPTMAYGGAFQIKQGVASPAAINPAMPTAKDGYAFAKGGVDDLPAQMDALRPAAVAAAPPPAALRTTAQVKQKWHGHHGKTQIAVKQNHHGRQALRGQQAAHAAEYLASAPTPHYHAMQASAKPAVDMFAAKPMHSDAGSLAPIGNAIGNVAKSVSGMMARLTQAPKPSM